MKHHDKHSDIKRELKETKEELKECDNKNIELENKLEEYKKKSEEYYEQLLRLKAEFENYRKRIDREKKDLIDWGKYDMIHRILPVFEMMQMAKSHINDNSDIENLKQGLNMIFAEFEKFFKEQGVKEIDMLNKTYDPMLCEIVGIVETDIGEDGKVVEIVQPGYTVADRLLRPAKVKITKLKSAKTSEPDIKNNEASNAGENNEEIAGETSKNNE